MKPNLLELFGQSLPAYFTLLMVGFALAIFLAQRQGRRSGLDHDTLIDLGLYAVIWGVLGGRALHVIADGYFWDYVNLCVDPSQVYWATTRVQCSADGGLWDAAAEVCRPKEADCFAWAKFWNGGLAYYGGLIAASAFGIYFLRKEKFPVGKGIDLVGMVIPLGLFFGRLGCFFGGCCFGQPLPEDHWLGISFPALSPASQAQWELGLIPGPAMESLPVHPTQLYEAAGCLLIAAIAMFWVRPKKRFDGQVMLSFLGLYAVLRFVLEFVRADDRGAAFGLSTSQLIGLVILAGVAYVWVRLSPKKG